MLDIRIYKTIGDINNIISTSSTSDEAIKKSLKLIVDSGYANYAILSYLDSTDNQIHPTYWLCPMDLSSLEMPSTSGLFGSALSNKETILSTNLKEDDPFLFSSLNKLTISSLVVVPFSNEVSTPGVITIINKDREINDEEKEVYNILILLVESLIKEKFVNAPWKKKNKIMTVNGVTKEFVNGSITTKVLKGINFDVFEGEFLCLLGESGCGKSTLLNLLGGMDKPTSGNIFFYDQNLAQASEKELTEYRRRNIGFIFQSYNLMPNLNAKENLDLIGELVENPMDSNEALSLVGLQERKANYPSQLSGGQQQRIVIARALVKNPKIIMADEPTAALDYETSIEVLQGLENIVAKKTTLIMVTHNEEISKMANRVIRVRDGKIYEITINNKVAKAKDLVW